MPPRPHDRAELEAVEPCLFGALAAQRGRVRLPYVHAAAWHRPSRPVWELEAYEEHAVIRVEHDCANGFADPELRHRASLAALETSESSRPTRVVRASGRRESKTRSGG